MFKLYVPVSKKSAADEAVQRLGLNFEIRPASYHGYYFEGTKGDAAMLKLAI